MSIAKKTIGVIPAYKPEQKLLKVVKDCLALNFLYKIIVVDDGSGDCFQELFLKLSQLPDIEVLHLGVNSGMGGALKYGFQHALYKYPEAAGVVVFDADGQHLPEDVKKLVMAHEENPGCVIWGNRDFHDSNIKIPFRSKFGNCLTEYLFALCTGCHIADTQTGLRYYPKDIAAQCTQLLKNRYEFQLEALLLCIQKSKVIQVPIQTIYENNNSCSHFNPLLDSIRIYSVLFRFILSSLVCSIADYVLFLVLFLLSSHILTSLIISRIFSVSLNFVLNRNAVFRSHKNPAVQGAKFLLLALVLFSGSYLGIRCMSTWFGTSPLISKIIVEIVLFILSFLAQRLWIFSNSKKC